MLGRLYGLTLVALSPVLVVLLIVRAVLRPGRRRVAANAQAAADRVLPGVVRVLRVDGMGEAGGFAARAVLVAAPEVAVSWGCDHRSAPGSPSERAIVPAVEAARRGASGPAGTRPAP
ncbi:hypothetical protein [Actinomycetospora soli]|uniref:hypothetical protein n=1 Tax=Actinomycetospora soli TaxID=2893887 RepID=UPI001E435A49|nr:hypothetical protein [Actinomycetospora soli]MCD2189084.1 hypothetical protein [Actinomycetospora soli]